MICKWLAITIIAAWVIPSSQDKPDPRANQDRTESVRADDGTIDDDPASAGPIKIQIDLLDGSRIVGYASQRVLAFDLGFDQIDLPVRLLKKIELRIGKVKHTLELANRDRFTATFITENIKMKTVFGDLVVATDGIKSIYVSGATSEYGRPDGEGLIAFYGFSEDSAGAAHNEADDRFHFKLGTNVFEEDPIRGNVLKFDGTAHVTIPHDDAFNPKNLTISVWVKPGGATGNYAMILGKTNGTGSWIGGYGLVQMSGDNNNVHFYANSYSSSVVKCEMAQGKWSHLTSVCDGKTVKIFLNGKQAQTAPLANGTMDLGKTPFTIGRDERNGVGRYPWTGSVDDLAFYGRALSADDVKRLYEDGKPDR